MQQSVDETVNTIRRKSLLRPSIAIVLGSGLGDFAETFEGRVTIPAVQIPNYPLSTVPGHKGTLVLGMVSGRHIVALQGRVHLYESGSIDTVCYPIRTVYALGARTLIVTNAAGGINRGFDPGDLMLITDQLNFSGRTVSVPTASHSPRKTLYSPELIQKCAQLSAGLGIRIRQGVYAGMPGPSYESAAEVEMLNRLGADAVGMSTVLEVEMGATLGMSVLGISCITNKATGVGNQKLKHDEVTVVANRVKTNFSKVLRNIISALQ